MTTYTYHIDLDERGSFMAHVENSRGRTIVAYDLPIYYCAGCDNEISICTCECDSFVANSQDWDIFDVDAGIVKHTRDIDGLERHYKQMGIMPQSAELVLVK